MKVVNQVYQTDDYSMFKTLGGNRKINRVHVKRLKDSFMKEYLFSPILVNKNYEIIDGQHRFEAAKELGLPINFMIEPNYGLRQIQMLNENTNNWKKLDYLKTFCDSGNSEYLKFEKFMDIFPDFGLDAAETILTGRSSGSEVTIEDKEYGVFKKRYFQEGELKIPDYKAAVENANKIIMIKPYYDGFHRKAFVRAMIGIFKNQNYDHSRFLSRLKANPTALQHCSNITQYKLLIENIYNFRSREKVSLRF